MYGWGVMNSRYDTALWHEVVKKEEYQVIKSFLPHTDLIIDLGAYKGFFAWWVLKNHFKGKLILVEPVKDFLDEAKKLLQKDFPTADVQFFECAIGNGDKVFYQDLQRWWHSWFDYGDIEIKFLQKFKKKIITPKICNLNNIFSDINISSQRIWIKMDIEWAELEILDDFTYWQNIDWLVIEYHLLNKDLNDKFDNLFQLLNKKFKKTKVFPSSYTDQVWLIASFR